MPPIEVWGPAVWTLFHTLAERVHENAYPFISKQLFGQIVNICKVLPCPDCSTDASNFLAKINVNTLKTKTDFKNFIYLFHNYVNVKKRKPLFNVINLNMYENYKLIPVVNNFILKFNTKGNMNLINESFQRSFVQNSFKKWFVANIQAFTKPNQIQDSILVEEDKPTIVVEDEPILEEDELILEEDEPILEEIEPSIILKEEQYNLEKDKFTIFIEKYLEKIVLEEEDQYFDEDQEEHHEEDQYSDEELNVSH
jgi:hypothetical protein